MLDVDRRYLQYCGRYTVLWVCNMTSIGVICSALWEYAILSGFNLQYCGRKAVLWERIMTCVGDICSAFWECVGMMSTVGGGGGNRDMVVY